MKVRQFISKYRAYLVAFFGPIGVVSARIYFNDFFGERSILAFYGIPVVIAALMGGLIPGIFATLTSLVMGLGLLMLYVKPGVPIDVPEAVSIMSFSITWTIVSIICEYNLRSKRSEQRETAERKRIEQKLSDTLARMTDAFIAISKEQKLRTINQAALNILDVPSDVSTEKELYSCLEPQIATELSRAIKSCRDSSEMQRLEVEAPNSHHWYQFRIYPAPEDSIVIFSHDVTDSKVLEETQAKALASERARRSDAESESRSKDDFVAMISHELRTPMTSIIGWSELLSKHKSINSDLETGLTAIEKSARLQSQLITELLDMSRIVTGNLNLSIDIINLRDLMKEIVSTYAIEANSTNRNIDLMIDEVDTYVRGDDQRIRQIFTNLISNALKFTNPGGTITIGMVRDNWSATVSVQDDGIGIAPENQERVFDRFKQLSTGIARQHAGLGIGLAIVKKLVVAHGGTVRVESAGAGKGSTFIVRLPLAVVSSAPGQMVEKVEDDRLDGDRIVLIEDDEATRTILHRILSDRGAAVRSAENARIGLAIIEEAVPDLLISDIGLPEIDGYGVIQRIRQSENPAIAEIPAIALTAFAGIADRKKAIDAGFNEHASKPIRAQELTSLIHKLLGRG